MSGFLGPAPKEGDWFTRMLEMKKLRAAHPYASDFVIQARQALETKDFEKAISLGGDALRMEPENAGALSVRSQALIGQGKMREALPDVEHVLRIEPQDAAANINLAWILFNTGQLDASIAHCTRALEKGFQGAEAAAIFNNRAGAWCFKGRFEKGLADFDAGIKADPNSWINQAGKSTVLARMGEFARAKLALDEAIRLNPQVKTDPPKFFLDDVIPQPVPLAEWREGREFLTVAQKGPADHRTIQDALNALKAGQYVKVLDKGPYRETILHNRDIADIALVSDVGTRIEVPNWHEVVGAFAFPNEKQKLHEGCLLKSPGGLRLSGFEFRLPPLPSDPDAVWGLNIQGAGDRIVEFCQVRYYGDLVLGQPAEKTQQFERLVGIGFAAFGEWELNKNRFLIQDNLIEGRVELKPEGPVRVTVRRNWIRAGQNLWGRMSARAENEQPPQFVVDDPNFGSSLVLPPHAATECSVRHNVFQSAGGIYLWARGPEDAAATAGRYLIENNLFDVKRSAFWTSGPDKDHENRRALCRAVTIENNIIRSESLSGFLLNPEDLKVVNGVWKIGHNCFGAAEFQEIPDGWAWFPKQPTDLIVAGPFLSDDPSQADYLRIAADGKLATGGVGGNLPSYIGPLPPGPAPQEGDWFTRLQQASEARE
jgi:tetratricopeptide (TPR) repeat protein